MLSNVILGFGILIAAIIGLVVFMGLQAIALQRILEKLTNVYRAEDYAVLLGILSMVLTVFELGLLLKLLGY